MRARPRWTAPSSRSRRRRTTLDCGCSSRARWPRSADAGAEGGRARPHRDRDRGGRCERPGQAARAPAAAVLELAPNAHPHATLDVVSIRSHRRGVRVRHRRLRRAAGLDAGARSAGGRRCLLTRAHRRALPERRRGRHSDRDRLGPAGHACAVGYHHFSSISSSRSSLSTSSSTLSCSWSGT